MKQKICFLLAMLFCITLQTMAQTDGDNPEDRRWTWMLLPLNRW